MNYLKESENKPTKSILVEEQRGTPTARLLLHTATLGTAVIGCALGYPKVPPMAGE
jgi:hypothetical protein